MKDSAEMGRKDSVSLRFVREVTYWMARLRRVTMEWTGME
jgi:hypothetical protein